MSGFAKELIASMEEAAEHAKGGKVRVKVHRFKTKPVDVKKARKALKMTQANFALLLGTSVSGLQKWEQGSRQPRGAARTLVHLIERAPKAVREALEERLEEA